MLLDFTASVDTVRGLAGWDVVAVAVVLMVCRAVAECSGHTVVVMGGLPRTCMRTASREENSCSG